MIKNLRTQILTMALLPPALVALLLGGYLTYNRISDLEDFIEARGLASLNILESSVQKMDVTTHRQSLQLLLNALLEEKGIRSVSLYDTNKDIILQAGPKPRELDALKGHLTSYYQHIDLDNAIFFTLPISRKTGIHQDNLGWISVEYKKDLFIVKRYESLITYNTILFISLLFSTIIGLRLGHHLTSDIREINNNIKRIKEGEHISSIEVPTSIELQSLADSITDMSAYLKLELDELRQNVELTTSDLKDTIDTIEIQNIELSLAQKEALTASKIKSEFLANTSHEIRTPLNGIIGFTKILQRTPLNPQQSEYLKTISNSAEGLLSIINDILDFSKIEAGKLELEDVSFNLRVTCEEVISLFGPAAYEKQIELVLLIYSDVPTELFGDPLRIKQVLSNLVSNAIKFTSEGTICIRISLEDFKDDDISISLSVTDTGIGIEPEKQKALFDAFSQTNSSISREYGGTGLGLAIVKKLVELMNGSIDVESTPDEGSTFTVTIPTRINPEQIEVFPGLLSGKTVILIQEHRLLRISLKHNLENLGLNVIDIDEHGKIQEKLDHYHCDAIIFGHSFSLSMDDFSDICIKIDNEYKQRLLVLIPYSVIDQKIQNISNKIHVSYKPITLERLDNALQECLSNRKPSTNILQASQNFDDKKILVVDDQPANLQLISVLLEDLGLLIETATNGKEALTACENQVFDLIFMDIQMPVMNGLDATMEIRSGKTPNHSTPIIAVTAHALADEKNTLLKSGMNDYLTKPIDETHLIKTLEHWLSSPDKIVDASSPLDPLLCLKLANNKKELAIDMFNMLVKDLDDQRQLIVAAIEKGDLENSIELVHKLHGACCYTGVKQLKVITQKMERALKESQLDTANTLLPDLINEVELLLEWKDKNSIEKTISDFLNQAR